MDRAEPGEACGASAAVTARFWCMGFWRGTACTGPIHWCCGVIASLSCLDVREAPAAAVRIEGFGRTLRGRLEAWLVRLVRLAVVKYFNADIRGLTQMHADSNQVVFKIKMALFSLVMVRLYFPNLLVANAASGVVSENFNDPAPKVLDANERK